MNRELDELLRVRAKIPKVPDNLGIEMTWRGRHVASTGADKCDIASGVLARNSGLICWQISWNGRGNSKIFRLGRSLIGESNDEINVIPDVSDVAMKRIGC